MNSDNKGINAPMNFNDAMFGNLRVIVRDGEPWFVVRDVLNTLGIVNISRAVAGLDADKKGFHTVNTPGGTQQVTIINESGLYSLILRSRKPIAKPFQDWVTGTVLPAIRKDGGYIMGEEKVTKGELSEDELLARAVLMAQQKIERLKLERDHAKAVIEEHLVYLTVQEWAAMNSYYLDHGARAMLGRNAVAVASEMGLKVQYEYITTKREGKTTGRTAVNRYPQVALDHAARRLGFAPQMRFTLTPA